MHQCDVHYVTFTSFFTEIKQKIYTAETAAITLEKKSTELFHSYNSFSVNHTQIKFNPNYFISMTQWK